MPGKPERRISSTYAGTSTGECPATTGRSPLMRAASETVGLVSPRSLIARGLMCRRPMRPAPEWMPTPAGTPADPVSRNRPPVESSSTARRTLSHTAGWSCHSSMSTGAGT